MEIAYAAHTEWCTFMLDANGICRWVVATNDGAGSPRSRHEQSPKWEKSQQAAARCVGAQYVAALDVNAKGGLLEMPRVGVPMLFARVDPETGRVSLVRTAPIMRFETREQEPQEQQAAAVSEHYGGHGRRAKHDSGLRERPAPDTEEDDLWEMATRPMRRDEVWHDVDPDPDSSENLEGADEQSWDVDTETAKVDPHPSTFDRMRARPPSDGGSGSRDIYTSSPPTHVGPAHSMPGPKAAPATRPFPSTRYSYLPPAPTNHRPTNPGWAPPRGPSYSRTPLPPPMPPPRRAQYHEVPPPSPLRRAPQPWAEPRPPLRRVR